MIEDSEFLKLVSLLTKLTVSEKLSWNDGEPPSELVDGTNDRIPAFFSTSYKNQKIGICEVRSQGFDGDRERFYWIENHSLVFFDFRGRIQWKSTRNVSGLESLFEVVRASVFDVDGILKNLLSSNSDED